MFYKEQRVREVKDFSEVTHVKVSRSGLEHGCLVSNPLLFPLYHIAAPCGDLITILQRRDENRLMAR